MRHAPSNVQAIIEPVVTSLGYELVGAEFLVQGQSGLLRVYIDTEDGIQMKDCQRVSHQLSGVLDVEDVISWRCHRPGWIVPCLQWSNLNVSRATGPG